MFDLDWLIHDYLVSVNQRPPITWSEAREEWRPELLHVSDLNACPRSVALRLTGAKEEPRAPQELRKFLLANVQHELIYKALDFGGHLEAKEVLVPMPDGWTGVADAVVRGFYDEDSTALNIADSKNPVAGAKKFYADYPKPEDIKQVSTYSLFLRAVYPELVSQSEGQVFYLPLGGAGEWKPTRFPLLPDADILSAMVELEQARDGLPELPDVLPLEIYWKDRRVYRRKDGTKTVSGTLMHGTNWKCRYCRYDCPRRLDAKSPHELCRVSKDGFDGLSSRGRAMADDISDFLRKDI